MTRARALAAFAALALAALSACGSPPSTSSTTSALVDVSPGMYDLGDVALGSTSTVTITVAPSGTDPSSDEIQSITESCSDFSLDLSALTSPATVERTCDDAMPEPNCANTVQQFDVAFTPTVAGPQSCTIDIALGNETVSAQVGGNGLAPQRLLTLVSPADATLGFGDVADSTTSAPLDIVFRSDGTDPVTITSGELAGDAAFVMLTSIGSVQLAPGMTETWTIECMPSSPGPHTGVFTVTSDAPDSPRTVALTCNGVDTPLGIQPSPARFADTVAGASTPLTITLDSPSAAITLDSVTVSPGAFTIDAPSSTTVSPGAPVTLTATFSPPPGTADGDLPGTLTVTFDGGSTRTADLIGPVRHAELSLAPGGQFDFGTVCSGDTDSALFVALNTGTIAFDVQGVEVTGAAFSRTFDSPSTYPASLAPHNAATFHVDAAPASGVQTGVLTVTSAIPGHPTTTVGLRARGVASGVAADPDAVDFDGVLVDDSSPPRTITITNCDPSAATITSATLTGADAADFEIVDATITAFPANLSTTAEATWTVQLRPRTAGTKRADLTIVHDRGTITVHLTGVASRAVLPPRRGTYYACNTTGDAPASALTPLAVALGFLLPRRRRRSPR